MLGIDVHIPSQTRPFRAAAGAIDFRPAPPGASPSPTPLIPIFPMKGLAFLLAAASCAALPLAAQTPLSVGQTVSGTLQAGDGTLDNGAYYDAYVIRGRPGQRVTVRMRSADFDTYLRWGRAQGGWVEEASNDDSGGGTDSRLMLTLGDERQYELRASAFDEDQAGAYELSVAEHVTVAPTPIRVGQSLQGELTEDDVESEEGVEDHYVFTARAGDVVTILAESIALDTYVILAREQGGELQELGSDDDGGVDTNSQLVAELAEDGEYLVIVRSFMGDETGPYAVRLEAGAAAPVVEEDEAFDEDIDFGGMGEMEISYQGSFVGPVRAGQDVAGTLGEGADDADETVQFYHDYTYRAAAGERLTIHVTSDDVDVYVGIGTGGGDDFVPLGEDDDGGEGLNARLEHTVEQAGEYTIRVTSAYPARGPYVLRVDSTR